MDYTVINRDTWKRKEYADLAQYNIDKVFEIADKITGLCREPLCVQAILQKLFAAYELTMDFEQYVLADSTVRSCLAWLKDTGRLNGWFEIKHAALAANVGGHYGY